LRPLAKKGKSVTIVERTSRPGGALKRFKRHGVPFDVGFHYTGCLGEGEILSMLWDYVGVLPQLEVKPFSASGHDALTIDGFDQTVRAYFSYEKLGDELRRIFPEESGAIKQYLEDVQNVCLDIPFYNPDLPLTPFLRGFRPPSVSLAQYLETLTKNPFLQAVLASPAFLYGVPASEAGFDVHAMVAHGFYTGAYGIDGGGQAIVEAYLQVLSKAGVDILVRQQVESIVVKDGVVAGVVTDKGTIIDCDDVIYTGHPSAVPAMVPEEVFRPVYRKRLIELKNTCSMFMVFAVAEDVSSLQMLDNVNYFHIPRGASILPDESMPMKDRALMMTAPGCRDSSNLTTHGSGVILFRPGLWDEVKCYQGTTHKTRPDEYLAWKEEIAAEMIHSCGEYWGDVGKSLRPLSIGTPLTFRDELAAPEGAAYGAQHSMTQFNPGARTRLPGLWLSGQSTLMTGVVSAALAGMVCVGEMTDLEPLWEEVRQCR
ncbi:MAG: NAD(P)/FAD-dependent oxidoreductase, partial [Desulfobulbaceae bacterium]|nr:NAD(P)/FAD-dependent oxidoreductase [Desulfobulbaceae bacterium]